MTRDGDPVPLAEERDSWIPAAELRKILAEAPADEGLIADLAAIRAAAFEEPWPGTSTNHG